jgi:hypothetical protein
MVSVFYYEFLFEGVADQFAVNDSINSSGKASNEPFRNDDLESYS